MDQGFDRRVMLGAAGLVGAAALARVAQAGSLTPPAGAVAPTPGPEPRIPINATNTPGNASAAFVISQPGSYYLTGNITIADTTRNAIRVTTSDVSIDMMGYRIVGVTNGQPGIHGTVAATNLRICNGTVRTCSKGIELLGAGGHVERIAATGNVTGISVTSGDAVLCLAQSNGFGIVASGGGVRGCTVNTNTSLGILVTSGTIVESCSASANENQSISVTNSTVTECVVYGSVTAFIVDRSVCKGCFAGGCLTGFELASATIRDCRAEACPGEGFTVEGGGSHIEGCYANLCGSGFKFPASSNFIVRNTAHACSTSYLIGAGPQAGIGLIVDATAAIVTSSNSYANWIV